MARDFPRAATVFVHRIFRLNNHLYAPSFLALRDLLSFSCGPSFWEESEVPIDKTNLHDDEFHRERAWLLDVLRNKTGETLDREEFIGSGDEKVECRCCFEIYEIVRAFHAKTHPLSELPF